jgi:MoxR-like ATPase
VDEDTWEDVLFSDEPGADLELSVEALEVVRELAARVNARTIAPQLRAIRRDLAQKHGIAPSDRRWKQAIKLIKASAALAGRDYATGDDLMILADSLWDKPKDRAPIFGCIAENANPALTAAMKLHDAAKELVSSLKLDEMKQRAAQPKDTVSLSQVNGELKRIIAVLDELPGIPEIEPLQRDVRNWGEQVARAGLRAMGIRNR